MNLAALGRIVTVVNRVRDEQGRPVPQDAYVDGQCLTIKDQIQLPEGLARIIVHQSMFKIDPITAAGEYRLGVKEWDVPCDPIRQEDVEGRELIDREALGPDRQFGYKNRDGKTYQPYRKNIPIRRHDPVGITSPRPNEDGAHTGGYGEAYTKG